MSGNKANGELFDEVHNSAVT